MNLWQGKLRGEILAFLGRERGSTDVFCFQEMGMGGAAALRDGVAAALPGFSAYESRSYEHETMPVTSHNCLMGFVSDGVEVTGSGDLVLCRKFQVIAKDGSRWMMGSRLQWIGLRHRGRGFTVANTHGIWFHSTKTDNPRRLAQSRRIAEFLSRRGGPRVLCGDFNLLPDTESIRTLERSGLVNLITQNGIRSTRSSHYPEEKPHRLADYVFVSRDVRVDGFSVMGDEVSDHLPLRLDFG